MEMLLFNLGSEPGEAGSRDGGSRGTLHGENLRSGKEVGVRVYLAFHIMLLEQKQAAMSCWVN